MKEKRTFPEKEFMEGSLKRVLAKRSFKAIKQGSIMS